ncbi:hypothetical protein BO94DRAFT_3709 [Aspergillus sclerotioniger CBS 115572]|uniref:Uncharacterized protein n=1 Tax=Aspergillus sclerotioniger CBS 115572 TaxID=1450535 RepID=A0A317XCD2_9EURO|nr:hypothetical protein BO94DRAFT_3709 [Aspergillus sclerotioniger CBS 115572]PWY96256.1 hypothetical protein BO94DRAFT_3709 [Aspergillus sclerotioniger CBS 115572]
MIADDLPSIDFSAAKAITKDSKPKRGLNNGDSTCHAAYQPDKTSSPTPSSRFLDQHSSHRPPSLWPKLDPRHLRSPPTHATSSVSFHFPGSDDARTLDETLSEELRTLWTTLDSCTTSRPRMRCVLCMLEFDISSYFGYRSYNPHPSIDA